MTAGNAQNPTIKLTYFNIEAAAEKVRLALAVTNTPFEDVRIAFPQWADMKPSTKYGVLPIMEVNGTELHQSMAQLRYVATLGDGSLMPKVRSHIRPSTAREPPLATSAHSAASLPRYRTPWRRTRWS